MTDAILAEQEKELSADHPYLFFPLVLVAELRRPEGPPSGAPYSYGKGKETHELIFSWLLWQVALLVERTHDNDDHGDGDGVAQHGGHTPINKLTSVFLCVCPVIDHEFRHNIVKVVVDPRGDSRVDPQTQFVFCDNKLSNCPLSLALHTATAPAVGAAVKN